MRRGDGKGALLYDRDECLRIPIFRQVICNEDTPDEMIVELADNKVFNIIPAYRPITRWLLNTGWFDGKKEK